jgi:hypothetical protein
MKINIIIKTILIIGVILITVSSCENQNQESVNNLNPIQTDDIDEIKLLDLKTPCDYLDAMEKVIDAAIEIRKKNEGKKLKNYSEEDKKSLDRYKKKISEITKAADKKYTKAEAEECENFERIIEKAKSIKKNL